MVAALIVLAAQIVALLLTLAAFVLVGRVILGLLDRVPMFPEDRLSQIVVLILVILALGWLL